MAVIDQTKGLPQRRSDPGTRCALVIPGASVMDPVPLYLRADSDGSVTIEGQDGVAVVWNVLQGETIWLRPRRVTAATARLIAVYP